MDEETGSFIKIERNKDIVKPGSHADFLESITYLNGLEKPTQIEHLPHFDDSDSEELEKTNSLLQKVKEMENNSAAAYREEMKKTGDLEF